MHVSTPRAEGDPTPAPVGNLTADTLTTNDGTILYYKDWGSGPTIVLSHGYPPSSDAWGNQMVFLAGNGYRVVAHDRRGFGRSSQPGHGYDYDTFADDLAALVDALDLSEPRLSAIRWEARWPATSADMERSGLLRSHSLRL